MRQSTFKSLWVSVKDLMSTILDSLYIRLFDKSFKLDIELEEKDINVRNEDEDILGI
tara:strand:+ start:1050 stop:1220 length:171 start_codon:yes stop_codon:yes gene_type:complete